MVSVPSECIRVHVLDPEMPVRMPSVLVSLCASSVCVSVGRGPVRVWVCASRVVRVYVYVCIYSLHDCAFTEFGVVYTRGI